MGENELAKSMLDCHCALGEPHLRAEEDDERPNEGARPVFTADLDAHRDGAEEQALPPDAAVFDQPSRNRVVLEEQLLLSCRHRKRLLRLSFAPEGVVGVRSREDAEAAAVAGKLTKERKVRWIVDSSSGRFFDAGRGRFRGKVMVWY